jgi:2-polyprenyl-3-methyl-5-hydroxy-6-metoxy-1,4-benzoquinol methylase
MNLDELQEHWNRFGRLDPLWAILTWPEKEGKRWQLEEFFRTGETEVASLLRRADSLRIVISFGKALDFGCGIGRISQALAAHFAEVHGVDIAPSMIDLARTYNRHPTRCRYVLNQSDDLRLYADETFDLIYSNLVLQHMEPRYSKNYIREFLRTLAPSGLLVFQQPGPLPEGFQSRPVSNRGGLKRRVASLAPALLVDIYRSLRRMGKPEMCEPRMEMHGIEREEIVDLVEHQGGVIVDVVDQVDELLSGRTRLGFEPSASPERRKELEGFREISYEYYVIKRYQRRENATR